MALSTILAMKFLMPMPVAKTANKEIGDPIDWLDEFDSMPIAEIFPEIIDLLESSISTKKKQMKSAVQMKFSQKKVSTMYVSKWA